MAKFCGIIAFNISVDKGDGVWEQEIVRRKYFGDILSSTRKVTSSSEVNDNVILSNRISVVMDSFAMTNIPSILYVEFNSTRWKIDSVGLEFPRLILTTGGVYNGE